MKRAAPILAAFAVIGCGRAPVARVYVDIERVALSDPLHFVAPAPNPTPPAGVQGSTSTVPPIAARKLDFSENKARLEKVQAAVDEAREQSAKQLARKLREAYLREIDAVENERLLKIGNVRTAAFDKAWAVVRARFLSYADARAPHAIRLALYAGFPDPDPQSRRALPAQKALQRQYERAQVARTAIADLEHEYESDVRNLLAGYDDEVAAAITAIRVEIEQMRADAELKAIQDAEAQVAKLTEQIESVLSGKAVVNLPASPGRTISVPSGAPIPAAPTIQGMTRAQAEADRLNAVRSDATIWAAHVGVELIDAPSKGQDRTDEFIVWRKQRQLGP